MAIDQLLLALRALPGNSGTQAMKPAAFDYVAPSRLHEALELLAGDEGATVLAGGQSLLPLLNMRLSRPSLLLDIKRLRGGGAVAVNSGLTRIGLCVTQARALVAPEVAEERAPMLSEALAHVGNRETWARGTVVGSIAHSDPAAEIPAVMVALGASYELTSVDGVRAVSAEDFHLGPYLTARSERELITAAEIPTILARSRWGFSEVRGGVFALCGLAAVCTPGRTGLNGLKLVAFGVGGAPLRLREVEQAVHENPRTVRDAVIAWAARLGHPNADRGLRAHLLATLIERQLAQFLERKD